MTAQAVQEEREVLPGPDLEHRAAKKRRTIETSRPKRQPRYAVVLWDDDDHSYAYVVAMLQDLFGIPSQMGFRIAREVDTRGRAVCCTTTLERAELKRDQIHAYGRDILIERCAGSMTATIEPVRE